MKTALKASMILAFFILVTGAYALNPQWELKSLSHFNQGQKEYNRIQLKLNEAGKLINEEGEAAFKIIKANNDKDGNENGIFVIDPKSGKILVSPSEKSLGNGALNSNDINGKAIAKEAILKAYTSLYGSSWDNWLESLGDVYNAYITQIAITLEGKVYALAIGKNDSDLQRLFVSKLVDKACQTIEEYGTEKAFSFFNRENSIFRFKDTYIFVYEIKSADNVTCLYNPNYPDIVGKNLINLKVGDIEPIKDIYALLQDSNSGWVRSAAVVPGTNDIKPKDLYVKSVEVNGKKLAVAAGVYLVQ
ncbi:MAG TPA: hypothetical protein DD381_09925 [Lentisphaeria bacterium]|nr:MAG: hypothetical protein A2X47_09870 [Lentisphaerae bacterium GWF2_38_69]HBM16642.1 hypothetical protein [Lentisphaeria bacterium]